MLAAPAACCCCCQSSAAAAGVVATTITATTSAAASICASTLKFYELQAVEVNSAEAQRCLVWFMLGAAAVSSTRFEWKFRCIEVFSTTFCCCWFTFPNQLRCHEKYARLDCLKVCCIFIQLLQLSCVCLSSRSACPAHFVLLCIAITWHMHPPHT